MRQTAGLPNRNREMSHLRIRLTSRANRSPSWWLRTVRLTRFWGDVTADLLLHLGVKVDYAAVDLGALFARRTQKSPPNQGGWHMYINSSVGIDFAYPTVRLFRADGNQPNGWATSAQVEAEVAAWYEAKSADQSREQTARRNRRSAAVEERQGAAVSLDVVSGETGIFRRARTRATQSARQPKVQRPI